MTKIKIPVFIFTVLFLIGAAQVSLGDTTGQAPSKQAVKSKHDYNWQTETPQARPGQKTPAAKYSGGRKKASAGIGAIRAREIAAAEKLTGHQPLSQNLRAKLVKGKPWPSGLAKKPVPKPMLGQLPYYPNCQWLMAGSDLVLVSLGTMAVVDVLPNVFQ